MEFIYNAMPFVNGVLNFAMMLICVWIHQEIKNLRRDINKRHPSDMP